ncbi:SDR family NAD(P)-dependent oxidoreductase, partial [Acinetobacter baumannii]
GTRMADGVVLITGSTSGIGKELARTLATEGWAVYVSARDKARAEQTAAELAPAGDVRALPVDLNVDDDASVRAAAAALARDPGRLDVLVNN